MIEGYMFLKMRVVVIPFYPSLDLLFDVSDSLYIFGTIHCQLIYNKVDQGSSRLIIYLSSAIIAALMFQKYLQKILKESLGDFIEDFDSKQLNIGLWSGKVDINNLKLKPSLLRNHKLPIAISFSSIKGLSLKIPWKSLFTSPLIVTIDSILVLCQFAPPQFSPEARQASILNLIHATIKQFGQELVDKGKSKSDLKTKASTMDSLAYKMLDNLYLSVKNIHIRFEQRALSNSASRPYSFGISLESLDLFAVDAKDQKVFVDRSKLNMSEALFRKKVEMRNFSVYCNYGKQSFVSELNLSEEKTVNQLLLSLILQSNKSQARTKNNYILIMNVFGMIEEKHNNEEIRHLLNFNFDKLSIKIDKDVLLTFSYYFYTLSRLTQLHSPTTLQKEISQESSFIARKYCNAFLCDFSSKDMWTQKDKESLRSFIATFDETAIIQKIKTILLYQISLNDLSRYLDLRGQDLNKGLIEVSKQLKELQKPNFKFVVKIPQISLFLVNQFSQTLLELIVATLNLQFEELIRNDNKVKTVGLQISSISALNNSNYILSTNRQEKDSIFCKWQIEVAPQQISVHGSLFSFSCFYQPTVLSKIIDLFQLNEVNKECKKVAIQKIQQLQSKVNKKVSTVSQKINVELSLFKAQVIIRSTLFNWVFEFAHITASIPALEECTLEGKSAVVKVSLNQKEHQVVQPFGFNLKLPFRADSHFISASFSKIFLNLDTVIIKGVIDLYSYLFVAQPSDLINGCQKSGEAFVKLTRWTKCLITLKQQCLYCWDLQNYQLMFSVHVTYVCLSKKGKIDVLQVSDKQIVYFLAFKDENNLFQWKKHMDQIISSPSKRRECKQTKAKLNCQGFFISLLLPPTKNQAQTENQTADILDIKINSPSLVYNDQATHDQHDVISLSVGAISIAHSGGLLFTQLQTEQPLLKIDAIIGNSSEILVSLKKFQAFYHPNIIISLLAFIASFQGSPQVCGDPYLQKEIKQGQSSSYSTLKLSFSSCELILFNKLTHLPLSLFACRSLDCLIKISSIKYAVEGIASCLQIKDLSGYPKTKYNKSTEAIGSQCVILQSEDAQKENKLTFSLQLFKEGPKEICNDLISTITFQASNCRIYYIHEVIFRVVDYINYQILTVLTYPELFPEFSGELQRGSGQPFIKEDFAQELSQTLKYKLLSKLTKDKALKNITEKKPLTFKVNLSDFKIFLLNSYEAQEGLLLSTTSVQISNTQLLIDKKWQSQQLAIPSDVYEIVAHQVHLSEIDSTETCPAAPLAQTPQLKVIIRYCALQMDLKYALGQEIVFHDQISFNISFSQLKLNLTQNCLYSISKTVAHNLTHEDGLDFAMKYEYTPQSKPLHLALIISTPFLVLDQKFSSNRRATAQVLSFLFSFSRNHQNLSKAISCKLLHLISYIEEQKSINLAGSKEAIKQQQSGQPHLTFEYTSSTNASNHEFEEKAIISDFALTINPSFLKDFYQMLLTFPAMPPLQKAYEDSACVSVSHFLSKAKQIRIIQFDRINLIVKTPTDQSFSILLTAQLAFQDEVVSVQVTNLEILIVSEQISQSPGPNETHKRTLLLPTSFKLQITPDTNDVAIGKVFFKLSLSDFILIYDTASEIKQLCQELQRLSALPKAQQLQFSPEMQDKELPQNHQSPIKRKSRFSRFSLTSKIIETLHKESETEKRRPASLAELSQIEAMDRESKIIMEGMELMVIDSLSKSLTPLFYINSQVELINVSKAKVQLYADYFNLRNLFWEPLVEKSSFFIDYKETVSVCSQYPQQIINLNISTNFIETLLKAISQEEIMSSRLIMGHSFLDSDQINSWILINELGQDISCGPLEQNRENETIFIRSGQAQTLKFLPKDLNFNKSADQQLAIRLFLGKSLVLKRLRINQMGVKIIKLDSENGPVIIIKNLEVDLSKNVKLLTLSSEVILENKSDITLKFNDRRQAANIQLCPGHTVAVPFKSQLSNIFYFIQRDEDTANLDELEQKSHITVESQQFKVTCNNKKLRKRFTFYPFYKIYNYLPQPIILNFKKKSSTALYCSLELGPSNSHKNFSYLYWPLEDLQVSICTDAYFCSDFTEWSSSFFVKDYRGSVHAIRCSNSNQQSPMISIHLTAHLIITNESGKSLNLYQNGRGSQLKEGQSRIVQNTLLALGMNDYASQTFYLPKHFCEIPIKVSSSDTSCSQISFCVFRNRKEVESRAILNIFEILPMHTFNNMLEYNVAIKQETASIGEIQIVPAQSQTILKWFLVNNKRRPPLFRLTLQASHYDWSFPINFCIDRQYCFLLRNRFKCEDIRFCWLKTQKVKETFLIHFRELPEREIPFVIRNSTNRYKVVILNSKTLLLPSQQTYFCWDDPTTNSNSILVCLLPIQEQPSTKQINFIIRTNWKEQEAIQSDDPYLTIQVIKEVNRQVYVFKDEAVLQSVAELSFSFSTELALRVALINNSISPAIHLLDLSTGFNLTYQSFENSQMSLQLRLPCIQLDNQTKPLSYFPVVLTTEAHLKVSKHKHLQAELNLSRIKLKVQEEFANDFMAFVSQMKKILGKQGPQGENNDNESAPATDLFISKLVLPKIIVDLEVQTKKFSIETIINLDKPDILSYPWKEFPYPIQSIAFNILSHLSISPWAFISSFGKGLQQLLTEQETSRGVEGFFQQLMAGATNSLSGMIGMIVGHDIEKVQNFVDGVNKGVQALGKSLTEIVPNFEGDYSPLNIAKELGMGAVNIVVKPVTGLLRMTLKISEGIRKTSKFQFGIGDNTIKKRQPIVFYERQQTYRTYSPVNSQLMNTLKKCLALDVRYFYLVQFIPIEFKLTNKKQCLAMGTEELVLFDVERERLIWRVQFDRIKSVAVINLCTVRIGLAQLGWRNLSEERVLQLDLTSQDLVKQVIGLFDKMRKASSIEF